MIIRPEKPVSETVAEIWTDGPKVLIKFFERDDDFRETVKDRGFRWDWDRDAWCRKCNQFTGSTQDRAAEIGNLLLLAGFVVEIGDDEIRRRAIAGEYEPEQLRWIAKKIEGKYKNYFAVAWEYGNDEIYKAARAIGGSRWSKPEVVVPSYQFEAVQDLADEYGFNLSPGALELIEEARQARDSALIVKPAAGATPQAGRKEPEEQEEGDDAGGIDATLRDDD